MSWLCTSSSASFFHYGKVPELFRNTSGTKTEKLKNWKTVFSREIQEEILHMDSVFQFFSFSVSGTISEYFRRNWKTEKLNPYGESLPECPWKIQFFSFSVSPEIFRNSSGNWKTEKLFFPERSRKRFSIWIQFFSFLVFQFFSFIQAEILHMDSVF